MNKPLPGENLRAKLRFIETHMGFVLRYGGRCRDCADENGVCPNSGLPCADARKAVQHVFDALAYGVNHGFISLEISVPSGPVHLFEGEAVTPKEIDPRRKPTRRLS